MEHGCEGLGVFWCIVEMIYEQSASLPLSNCKSIAFALHVECKVVESIINDFDLFKNDGVNFWSESINNRLNKRSEITEKRKQAAIKRWKSNTEMQMQCKPDVNAMLCNAIKEKKRKEYNTSKEVLVGKTYRFSTPTLEEIKNYCLERENNVDADTFFNFYESKGWMVGKNKMKNWKAAIHNWEKDTKGNKGQTTSNVNDIWEK